MCCLYLHYFVPLRWDIKWNKNGHMSTKIIHPTQVRFPLNRAHIIALLYILCFRKNEEAYGSGKQCLFLIGKLENKIVNTKTVKTNSPLMTVHHIYEISEMTPIIHDTHF